MPDAYRWRARLTDGRVIEEAEAGAWANVPPVVCEIELVPNGRRVFDGRKPVRVRVPEGAVPVCFRRRRFLIRMSTGTGAPSGTATCIGWEGPNGCAYLWVEGDGTITGTDRRDEENREG